MDRDNVFYYQQAYHDDDSLKKLILFLEDNDFVTMTAMASVYDHLAAWVREGKAPEWKGDFIVLYSVSETLKDSTRKTISDYFRCPVYVLYANEGNGVLAVEDGSGFGCRANIFSKY